MPRPPNILVLFSDQQRWDTLGCYGQALDTTPCLDRMAAEGVRFEHAFTCQPVCGPARAALQTGRYPAELGCHTNNRRLPAGERTVAHWLSEAGYEVGYLGKWHLASSGALGGPDDFRERSVPPDRRGGYTDFWLASDVLEYTSHGYDGHLFDAAGQRRDFPAGRYRADALTDWALEYLRARRPDRPFFLFVSYLEPHHQNDCDHVQGPHGSQARFRDFTPPGDFVGAGGNWAAEYPDYLGAVNSLDANAGRLRDELARQGLSDDTLVVYLSDHGCHFKTRNAKYKQTCHDASLRIPLLCRGPGFRGGRTIRDLVSLIDVPPTLLTAAGIRPPATMRGRPLQDLVAGNAAPPWPDDVYIQTSETFCGRAIRTRRWKYAAQARGTRGAEPYGAVYDDACLYDLASDPYERENLVGRDGYDDVLAEMRCRLQARLTAAGEGRPEAAGAGQTPGPAATESRPPPGASKA